jgi:hypothetical protein
MSKYVKLMEKLSMLSDVLGDVIVVDMTIREEVYWIGLKSMNGKTLEKKIGGSLHSSSVMFKGEVGKDCSINDDIVGAIMGYEYVFDAYGDKRHEFRL